MFLLSDCKILSFIDSTRVLKENESKAKHKKREINNNEQRATVAGDSCAGVYVTAIY